MLTLKYNHMNHKHTTDKLNVGFLFYAAFFS